MYAVLIFTLDASAGILHQYLHSLDTSKHLFVAFLHTQVAGIVARVIIVVCFHIGCRYFADVAEDVGSDGVTVLAYCPLLDKEAGE